MASKEKTKYRAGTFPSLFSFLHFLVRRLQSLQTLPFSYKGTPMPKLRLSEVKTVTSLRGGREEEHLVGIVTL